MKACIAFKQSGTPAELIQNEREASVLFFSRRGLTHTAWFCKGQHTFRFKEQEENSHSEGWCFFLALFAFSFFKITHINIQSLCSWQKYNLFEKQKHELPQVFNFDCYKYDTVNADLKPLKTSSAKFKSFLDKMLNFLQQVCIREASIILGLPFSSYHRNLSLLLVCPSIIDVRSTVWYIILNVMIVSNLSLSYPMIIFINVSYVE